MADPATQFLLPEDWDLSRGVEAIQAAFTTASEPEQRVNRTFYDSFDWRLYEGGGLLCLESIDGDKQLVWSGIGEVTPRQTMRLQEEPGRFVEDIPPGLAREQIAPLLEMRALLPQVDIKGRRITLRILDDEEKTVLRIVLEQTEAREPGRAEYKPMGISLGLKPVRGYDGDLGRVQRFLEKKLKLDPVVESQLDTALAAIGRKPLDYSSKLDFQFAPDTRTDQVAKQIHLHLLDTLEINIPGTKADLDSEFLHDLRVAVRRTRSALTQVKGVFTDEEVEQFKARLAWIGTITSPVRDLDVYLLDYEKYRDSLPEQFRPDLEPLHQFLLAHQKLEQQAMVKRINSPHFRKLLKEWRAFLEAPVPEQTAAPNATKEVARVAGKRIYKVYHRVLSEGLAIDAYSPADALHELRKNCKKLRYLLEFFTCLYPKKQIKGMIKALKVLLDNLGSFQDLEVQADKLREFAHQMVEEGSVPADTLLAMGMLVDGLLSRQHQARLEFSDRFAQFGNEQTQADFEMLFAPKKKKKRGSEV